MASSLLRIASRHCVSRLAVGPLKTEASFASPFVRGQLRRYATEPVAASQRRGPVTWASLALMTVAGAGAYYYFKEEKRKIQEAIHQKQTESIGVARIGGPFELVNQDGKTVTDKDFHGKWLLIYFGFTHCPDICPDELDKITEALEKIDKHKNFQGAVQPIFISIDPRRDTPAAVKEYVKQFHPRLIGLTGTKEQVMKVCKAYRVYASIPEVDPNDEDYLVDHSIIQYFVGPDGKFVEFYAQNKTADEMANSIMGHIRQTRMVHKSGIAMAERIH
eukprot:Colp12_sorted_trinity150504_noHs@2144